MISPRLPRLAPFLAVLVGCGDSSLPLDVDQLPGPQLPADPPPDPSSPPNPPEPPAGSASIFLGEADGSNARLLVAGEWPAWSPDGRRIAFQRGGNIYVIATDASGETLLRAGREPAWAPDGRRLAFTGVDGIAIMHEDG